MKLNIEVKEEDIILALKILDNYDLNLFIFNLVQQRIYENINYQLYDSKDLIKKLSDLIYRLELLQ